MSTEILIVIAVVLGIAYLLKRNARLRKQARSKVRPR